MKFSYRQGRITYVMAGILLIAGCAGAVTRRIDADRAELHDKPVALVAIGHPDASIDSLGSVKIGGDVLPLSFEQRSLAMEYRAALVDLMDLAFSKASRLSNHVVARMVFGMATGRLDSVEKDIDQETSGIAHSPDYCRQLEEVRRRQSRMLWSIIQLSPYANVDSQVMADCLVWPDSGHT